MNTASTDDGSEIVAALGAAIREHRTAADLSQTKLAQLAGISRPYLNLVEAGRKCPTVVVLVHLARGLGIDPALLLETQPLSTATHRGSAATRCAQSAHGSGHSRADRLRRLRPE